MVVWLSSHGFIPYQTQWWVIKCDDAVQSKKRIFLQAHTYSADSQIIYEHMKMTQQKTQEANTFVLIEWKLTVTPS